MKNLVFLFFFIFSFHYAQSTKNLLIFTKTAGFRHECIEKGVESISEILQTNGIRFYHTEDSRFFIADSLKQFDGVLFLNTTGDILNEEQQQALETFFKSGKGFIGIHSATDTEYDWPWYGKLVGGYFKSHPKIQKAQLEIKDSTHISTRHLEKRWLHEDEWYNFKQLHPNIQILMYVDESSYQGGEMGDNHPVSWYREFEGGRMFYTALGHTLESYDDVNFRKHILGGILYVLKLD